MSALTLRKRDVDEVRLAVASLERAEALSNDLRRGEVGEVGKQESEEERR